MVLTDLKGWTAAYVRLIGLALIVWSVIASNRPPALHGRGLVVLIAFAGAVAAWLYWTARPGRTADEPVTPDIWVLAIAGGVICQADPSAAGSAFAFVAIVSAAIRGELSRVWPVPVAAGLALAVSGLVYDNGALGILAYCLGFAGAALASSNARQSRLRGEEAELLLAQTQRSQEQQLRTARLEESTRLAREIHDVLAHSLAGLTIQPRGDDRADRERRRPGCDPRARAPRPRARPRGPAGGPAGPSAPCAARRRASPRPCARSSPATAPPAAPRSPSRSRPSPPS